MKLGISDHEGQGHKSMCVHLYEYAFSGPWPLWNSAFIMWCFITYNIVLCRKGKTHPHTPTSWCKQQQLRLLWFSGVAFSHKVPANLVCWSPYRALAMRGRWCSKLHYCSKMSDEQSCLLDVTWFSHNSAKCPGTWLFSNDGLFALVAISWVQSTTNVGSFHCEGNLVY